MWPPLPETSSSGEELKVLGSSPNLMGSWHVMSGGSTRNLVCFWQLSNFDIFCPLEDVRRLVRTSSVGSGQNFYLFTYRRTLFREVAQMSWANCRVGFAAIRAR